MITHTTTSSEPPDWSGIEEDIHCPLCGYDLRGISEPRCPECGYMFAWPDLLDPTRRLHPYLFEHHPERNIWSFWRTAIGGLLPRRFWTHLHPSQPSRPKRLVLYFAWISLICFVLLQAVMGVLLAQVICQLHPRVAVDRARILSGQITIAPQEYAAYDSLQAWLDAELPVQLTAGFVWREARAIGSKCWLWMQIPMLVLAWPWVTFACLLIFQQSMRRARLRTSHVLRCVIYSGDVFLWVWLLTAVAVAVAFYVWGQGLIEPLLYASVAIGLGAALAFSYRLAVAYRRYLKFDKPITTILCCQLILWLTLLTGGVVVVTIVNE